MKFGKYLEINKEREWSEFYIDYKGMKEVIKIVADSVTDSHASIALDGKTQGVVSLSVPSLTKSDEEFAGKYVEEDFFSKLEMNIRKVQNFTHQKVTAIRKDLADIDARVEAYLKTEDKSKSELKSLKKDVSEIGTTFIRLEKFVNMNFTGFYKILKKHDKSLPLSQPCRPFYMARLHNQSWVRGDYSNVLVTLSRIHGSLRGDTEGKQVESGKQDFVRSTKKYWVRVEDVSEVKHLVLQHLPVFLQKNMGGESDSQLINSVYLDNAQLELYHGRLDKAPRAIALRLRWYGTGGPGLVFVERKTHEDSWTGDVSVKERFAINESQVMEFLSGHFDLDEEEKKLVAKGQSEDQISDWKSLVYSTIQAINSKQLVPTLRTQCMRTAFQIPFDATVRISLDTNLCMINDREPGKGRWYRDPSLYLSHSDITRFPHAILEVKLQVTDESAIPSWITDLIQSGLLHEVHKFSKFIHGCSVLHSEDVQGVPYWIDDSSLKQSIIESGAGSILSASTGANEYYNHLMPFSEKNKIRDKKMQEVSARRIKEAERMRKKRFESDKNGRDKHDTKAQSHQVIEDFSYYEDETDYDDWCGTCFNFDSCCIGFDSPFGMGPEGMSMAAQRVEPKIYLANERTFIHWLHMSVTMASAGIALMAFGTPGHVSEYYGLVFMPVSFFFCLFAMRTYLWRLSIINNRIVDRWDDPKVALFLAGSLAIALTFNLGLEINSILSNHFSGLN